MPQTSQEALEVRASVEVARASVAEARASVAARAAAKEEAPASHVAKKAIVRVIAPREAARAMVAARAEAKVASVETKVARSLAVSGRRETVATETGAALHTIEALKKRAEITRLFESAALDLHSVSFFLKSGDCSFMKHFVCGYLLFACGYLKPSLSIGNFVYSFHFFDKVRL